ncbi:TPA: hypothetical protein NKA38_004743 [Vibrio parahaemolyticus]|nr:hypothetical protein [Vibrio parahaemolyticus]
MRTDAFSLNTTQVLNSDNSSSLSRLSANKMTQGAAASSTSSNRIPDFSKLNHQPINLVEATKLCYPESEFKPIPKQIHMIRVASLPQEKQIKYVRDWAKKNPQAAINLWVDSRHFDTYQKNKSANTAARSSIAPLGTELQLRNLSQQ